MFGPNHLFKNKGDSTFEDVTDAALKRTSWGGMGARFFDGNGDDLPDLYVVDIGNGTVYRIFGPTPAIPVLPGVVGLVLAGLLGLAVAAQFAAAKSQLTKWSTKARR